jgi:hypothetical protein
MGIFVEIDRVGFKQPATKRRSRGVLLSIIPPPFIRPFDRLAPPA